MDPKTIQNLSSTGHHQECLQACQQILQSEPEKAFPWKFAGKSLLALGQFEKAQQYLAKAHELDTKDPEITEYIGNILINLGRSEDATEWYKKSLEITIITPLQSATSPKSKGRTAATKRLLSYSCEPKTLIHN